MEKITDNERHEVCSHLHAACEILDQHPDLTWCEDPLLRIAHFISLAKPDAVNEAIYMILAIAPDEQVYEKLAEITAGLSRKAEAVS